MRITALIFEDKLKENLAAVRLVWEEKVGKENRRGIRREGPGSAFRWRLHESKQ